MIWSVCYPDPMARAAANSQASKTRSGQQRRQTARAANKTRLRPKGRASRAKTHGKKAAHGGAPQGYGEVRSYFATVSERARALGVQRQTIRVWDKAAASRLREESEERVQLLVTTARDIANLMGEPRAVGRWLLTEQPLLRGVSPANLLLSLGASGQEVVRQLAVGVSPVNPADVPDGDAFWRALEAKLGEADVKQVKASVKRARESGVSGSLSL
jgi:Flp pilus assembly protein TadG